MTSYRASWYSKKFLEPAKVWKCGRGPMKGANNGEFAQLHLGNMCSFKNSDEIQGPCLYGGFSNLSQYYDFFFQQNSGKNLSIAHTPACEYHLQLITTLLICVSVLLPNWLLRLDEITFPLAMD